MRNIRIFVSHRIDINSELVNNPIYYPVRCGAVFDNNNFNNIAGDDTGDNISEKRMSFCEFTVQYWAWKNIPCDYYGLCHYRRYLSFAEKRFRTDEFQMVHCESLVPHLKRKFDLLNPQNMEQLIAQYDILVSEYADVEQIPLSSGKAHTVRQLWEAHDGLFIEKSTIDLMFSLIDKIKPEYSASAREYFDGRYHRGFNCFVMRKELFNRLCEFQFPIMEQVEQMVDMTGYSQTMKRTPAFVGEMLYGIFVYHISTHENWKIKELQLVFFSNTDKINGVFDLIKRFVKSVVEKILRSVLDLFFPKGTLSREKVKDFYYKVTGAKRRGVACVASEREQNEENKH